MKNVYKQIQEVIQANSLLEKKEAIATTENTNMTLHCNSNYTEVSEDGSPQVTISLSISSTGGKDFARSVADGTEADNLEEGIRSDLRRAIRKFDKHVELILQKYKLKQ